MLGEDDDMEMPAGKRVGPEDVRPVVFGSTRFEAIHWGRARGLAQNGGYLSAVDDATGRELWILKVYDVVYDPDLEEDVQDVFIERMAAAAQDGELEVTDEKGRRYIVDTRSRSVRAG